MEEESKPFYNCHIHRIRNRRRIFKESIFDVSRIFIDWQNFCVYYFIFFFLHWYLLFFFLTFILFNALLISFNWPDSIIRDAFSSISNRKTWYLYRRHSNIYFPLHALFNICSSIVCHLFIIEIQTSSIFRIWFWTKVWIRIV